MSDGLAPAMPGATSESTEAGARIQRCSAVLLGDRGARVPRRVGVAHRRLPDRPDVWSRGGPARGGGGMGHLGRSRFETSPSGSAATHRRGRGVRDGRGESDRHGSPDARRRVRRRSDVEPRVTDGWLTAVIHTEVYEHARRT